ncbi:MAG: DUF1501 domain-containing protein [Rhodospirillales bacterium]|nr:DUF1501 domain-containing protein [Rhodospirillales bacterium]
MLANWVKGPIGITLPFGLAQVGASPEISFMQMPSRLGILFNGAALLILGVSVAAAVRYTFVSDDIAACSTRYEHGTQLSLARPGGELLTPADLQARSAGTDWGLIENARVIEARSGSAKQAIEVRFTPAKASATPADGKMGMGFSWMPRSAGKPDAACLTYSIFLSKDFDFAKGGRLPGFVAGARDQDVTAGGVSSRIAWRPATITKDRGGDRGTARRPGGRRGSSPGSSPDRGSSGTGLHQMAQAMKHICLVRSMNSKEGSHPRASFLLHHGYLPMGGVKFPTLGSQVTSNWRSEIRFAEFRANWRTAGSRLRRRRILGRVYRRSTSSARRSSPWPR